MLFLVAIVVFCVLLMIDAIAVMWIFSILHDAGMNVPAIGFGTSISLALLVGVLLARPSLELKK